MTIPFTVAAYLKQRLEELGLDRLFGVAGNYTAPFLDTILEDGQSPIKIIGMPNEICAGYAADGYARIKGIGAVGVTYGVGAFSLLNATAGSSVEQAPVVVINGAPTNKEFLNQRYAGLLYSHMMTDANTNLDVYRRVTVAAERIVSAGEAPFQIDAALSACVIHGQPVYLEVLEDVWRATCSPPSSKLPREQRSVTQSGTSQAVAATLALIQKYGKPLFWAGVEIQRQGLQDRFLNLIDDTDFYFTTSVLGKSVVSEDHPRFAGVYSPSVQNPVQKIVQDAGCLIGIGAWTTGKDVNNQDILSDSVALASHGGVIVGPQFFPSVTLGDYIDALRAALKQQPLSIERYAPQRPELLALAAEDSALTYDSFFQAIENWISREHAVVSDAGFPLLGAQSIHISEPNGFVAQASWLAIGYSTPAAVGVKCAMPDKRVVVLVGDGAFQETCQSVSSQHYLGHNTVVFVLANGIYGIEQKLVNPNPFRTPPTDYQNPLLDAVYPYNELHDWAYEKLPAAWGGQGRIVATVDELMAVLAEINEHPRENFVVNVRLPKVDVPGAVRAGLAAVGEDETENPAWPPSLLF